MRKILFLHFFVLVVITARTQSTPVWKSFYDKKKDLYGFKNEKGKVVIPPKFSAFIIAQRFEHIMAAAEFNDTVSRLYYLTKSGKEIGHDSVWMVDNTPDCESEGFIRFKNKVTGYTGMMNRNGKVVIPAEYNQLSPVHNGFVVALKGATRKHLGEKEKLGDEHFTWEGGTHLLLDTSNTVLITNFTLRGEPSFYNYFTSAFHAPDSNYITYLPKAGVYYHFLDYEKEFKVWLKNFLRTATKEELKKITLSKMGTGNYSTEKIISSKSFIDKNHKTVLSNLALTQKPETDFFISKHHESTLSFIDQLEPGKYFDHCGQWKTAKYPVFSIIINKDKTQAIYTFIRTEKGYKLMNADDGYFKF